MLNCTAFVVLPWTFVPENKTLYVCDCSQWGVHVKVREEKNIGGRMVTFNLSLDSVSTYMLQRGGEHEEGHVLLESWAERGQGERGGVHANSHRETRRHIGGLGPRFAEITSRTR